ncbi:hypothetical protein ACIBCA_09490 [Kitasatospora sp. NPDC051170]|uniref:hypothetical protein n=1 Tax=Kitasatospora sp. NPDC051170 TaxID=3364056 RepID=UPI003793063C
MGECRGSAALRALFEQTWDQARPFGESAPRDPRGLTGQERELLRLHVVALGWLGEPAPRR